MAMGRWSSTIPDPVDKRSPNCRQKQSDCLSFLSCTMRLRYARADCPLREMVLQAVRLSASDGRQH